MTDIKHKKLFIRFFEELNDFLPPEKRKFRFEHEFIDRTSIKDLIESFGVPHTEVDLILVNNKSVSFDYLINDKDDISVYPVFESFDIADVQHLRSQPLREPKFVCDVHLGKLVKKLRMLGLDTKYRTDLKDSDLVSISLNEKRTILTKDIGILKRREITHGYFIRNNQVVDQMKEVVQRFQLLNIIKEFSRCLECNSILEKIDKEKIFSNLPEKIRKVQDEFFICNECDKIFWKGTHYKKMLKEIRSIKKS